VANPPRAQGMLNEAAERFTALVGDGCLIRVVDGSGALAARAADHRDDDRRRALLELLDAPPLTTSGWLGQAIERGRPVPLPTFDSEALAAAGLPSDERLGDAIAFPVSATVLAVLVRDRIAGPYGSREREQCERVAADVRAALGGEPPAVDEPQPAPAPLVAGEPLEPGSFDPLRHGLVEATAAGLWVVDPCGRTLYANEAVSELVGWPSRDLVGLPVSEFLGRSAAGRTRRVDGATICDRPLLRDDGATAWLEVTTRQMLDDRGEPVARMHTLLDVTDRRGREIELSLALDRQRAQRALAEKAIDAELEDLIELAASTLANQLEVELVSIASYEEGEDSPVEPLALVGWPAVLERNERRPPAHRVLIDRSAVRATLRSGDPVVIADYHDEALYEPDPMVEAAGVRSATVVGFAHGTAVVAVHSAEPGAFGTHDVALVEYVARVLERRWEAP
jgi:PAS domain S-box-containing protein